MAKKKKVAEPFLTNGHSNFAALYFDMLDSKAWNELSGNSIKLYLKMRRKYTVKVANGISYDSNANDISIPKKEYLKYMGRSTYEGAIDQLIECGFVKVIEYKVLEGSRKVIIYGFSNMWKKFGDKDFEIKNEWRRTGNQDGGKKKDKLRTT